MKFGKVIGNVVSTKKTGKIDGLRLLLISELDINLDPVGRSVVSTDTVNARHGDIVLICASSSSRFTKMTTDSCTDNSIIAIVDSISLGKEILFQS